MATHITNSPLPSGAARLDERIALTTEAAHRAIEYLAAAPHRPIAPTDDAIARLDAFRRPLQDAPRPAHDVLGELDEIGSPATTVQAMGRYFGYVNGVVEPAAAAASILAGAWDQNAALPAQSPAAAALDEVAAAWIVDLLGLPTDAVATFTTDTDALTLVLLQAGNVTTGASDPFDRIIPGVRERGGWVHVDGAFGLWAAASPALRAQVTGVELADRGPRTPTSGSTPRTTRA